MRSLLLLLCFFTSLFADDLPELFLSSQEEIASHPFEEVSHLVNPLTGQPSLAVTDLVAKGREPLFLRRLYISPLISEDYSVWQEYNLMTRLYKTYKGWVTFPHRFAKLYYATKTIRITDPGGITLDFDLSGKLITSTCGMTNVYGETPSGKYDLRNTKVHISGDKNKITVIVPDGTERIYHHCANGLISATYRLEKEILPHGKLLKYTYKDHHFLHQIASKDLNERHTYASITIKPEDSFLAYTTSTGKKATYRFDVKEKHFKIRDGHKKFEAHRFLPPLLQEVSSPFFRHEHLEYSSKHLLEKMVGKEQTFSCTYRSFNGHYRVFELKFPKDNTFETAYTFHYDPPVIGKKGGATYVKTSDGREINYYFSKDLLLEEEEYKKEGKLQKEKIYRYTPVEHWLDSIEIKNPQGQCIQRKHFFYDALGNAKEEVLTGNLTGEGIDTYKIWYHYSQDGRHLLQIEDHNDGRSFHYDYLPGTNLLTSKFSLAQDIIITREFYEYDDCYNLVKKIIDNGSAKDKDNLTDVTERHITTYILRQEQPFLHMPEWIEESSLDGLLKKTHLVYDLNGNIEKKTIYDAHGEFAYTLEYKYNERGDVIEETNALGATRHFDYDERGHQKFASSFSGRLEETMAYDIQGRLKEHAQKGDTISRVTTFEYDPYDALLSKQDHLGNITRYSPDHLAHHPSSITYPPINGQTVESHFTYNVLGFEIASTDPRGYTTTKEVNVYGFPIQIHYPDGSSESFRYFTNGKLARHENQEGHIITYEYDPAWRLKTKTFFTKDKEEIAQETFTYIADHIKTFTDKEGHVTIYEYDRAGRKIEETREGRTTLFNYDSLGRIFQITEAPRITELHYDFLNQITQKKQLDSQGNTLRQIDYTYDKDNNLESIACYPNNQAATEIFVYDPLGREIEHHDPRGYIRKTIYSEDKELVIIHIDEKDFETIKTFDAHNNLIQKQTPLGITTFHYDLSSNLLEQDDTTQKVRYSYTPLNQVNTETRGADTSIARITTYTYTPSGQLQTKLLPNGTLLTYTYSPLGHLRKLTSSDGTIHHTFSYNHLGHLLEAKDHIHNLTIQRTPDPFGNILAETFSTGYTITKTYDRFNRPLIVEFPSGHIRYSYDPCSLKQIERFSTKKLLYTHQYNAHDLFGNILFETFIYGQGKREYTYHPTGRLASLISPCLTEEYTYDERNNIDTIIQNGTIFQYTYDPLSQITSESFHQYQYDALYNRTAIDGKPIPINSLNELEELSYDSNGNLKNYGHCTYHYDALSRLTQVTSSGTHIQYLYDPLDRRLMKTIDEDTEIYLYDGMEEFGAVANNQLKNLKVENCAIELDGKAYLPLIDGQNNIIGLIDPIKESQAASYTLTAFGEPIQTSYGCLDNPWRFVSKRQDPETQFIYFGKRYYVPTLGRWLTTDPAGLLDSVNPYQYIFNNPFNYVDEHGEFAIVIPLLFWGATVALPTITAVVSSVATSVACGAITAGLIYTGAKAMSENRKLNHRETNYHVTKSETELEEEKKTHNTNPFEGPVSGDVIVVDGAGNAIKIPQGNWITGSLDGTWLQEMQPGGPKGTPTGLRKDGGGHPWPKHKDLRANAPHCHVPGITNPDGTDWLPLKK